MRVDLCLNPQLFTLAEVQEMIPAVREVLLRHHARGAYIFGSVLQDPDRCLSDLDIAVLPPPEEVDWLDYYNNVHGDLCRVFQADNIDLVLLDQAPLSLQAHVVLSGLRILEGRGVMEWEERVLARYADLAGWRRENWIVTRGLSRQGMIREINMIDRERVERFVFLIRDAVRELEGLGLEEMGLETYLADKRAKALSEHYLRIAIEATLDLGRHVVVKTGLGLPHEYREVGKILQEQGIVPADLGSQLQAMAGMRNVLVHLYWDIDYALLYRTIMDHLDTFGRTIQCIFQYLEGLEAEEK
ncbi:MAG: DUF86 domain-containing protein [Ardenticatenia bacterium]|nr:DUF86 domain-containing protein [Ardenticatenia bacterium]